MNWYYVSATLSKIIFFLTVHLSVNKMEINANSHIKVP